MQGKFTRYALEYFDWGGGGGGGGMEMFPAIEYRMNGLLFSAIGGCCCCDDGGAVHTWVP